MSKLIRGKTCCEVWTKAATFLSEQSGRSAFNLFLHVDSPMLLTLPDRQVFKIVDGVLRNHSATPVMTIAETIFPMDFYRYEGVDGVFDQYPDAIEELYSGRPGEKRWGTYALRMLRQRGFKGDTFNQLDRTLLKLKRQTTRAAFELVPGRLAYDEDDDAVEIPIYDPAIDGTLPIGTPCLSHVSVSRDKRNGTLYLNATYRSQRYFEKALGNLFGLAALQDFLCRESEHILGPLVVNATFATLDTKSDAKVPWTRDEVLQTLKKCEQVYLDAAKKVETNSTRAEVTS